MNASQTVFEAFPAVQTHAFSQLSSMHLQPSCLLSSDGCDAKSLKLLLGEMESGLHLPKHHSYSEKQLGNSPSDPEQGQLREGDKLKRLVDWSNLAV
jgi:hypothetical protein